MKKNALDITFCLLLAAVAAMDYRLGVRPAAAIWALMSAAVFIILVSRNFRGIFAERTVGAAQNFPGIYYLATWEKRENIFRAFMLMHPNSTEVYDPTPENVNRWAWHISRAEDRARAATEQKAWTNKTPPEYSAIVKGRSINTWTEFDPLTKLVYEEIARRFIGPVFACGSRVRGDYIDATDPDEIRQWRWLSGKSDKRVSDFDVWIPKETEQVSDLPQYADLVRHGVPESEKILIPMVQWDFSKLPKHEHARVIQLVNAGQWRELISIHDQYGLSPYEYCCDISGLQRWYKWAVKSGTIKAE